MPKEKLVISSKKYRGDSTVISIRLPDELVKELDKIAEEMENLDGFGHSLAYYDGETIELDGTSIKVSVEKK